MSSLHLIHSGSAEDFVSALCTEAIEHKAAHHEYLRRLSTGDLPDIRAAIRDYCYQYYFYSAEFTSYLEAVIGGLSSTRHREIIRHNLEEEKGLGDRNNPEQLPHSELFKRFRRASGVSDQYEAQNRPCTTVLVWRDLFLQKCQSRQPGVGLGAIGIATELIVSTVYGYLIKAVTSFTEMTPQDYLFLSLHLDCDDAHAADLREITIEIAKDSETREAIRFGVMSSLNLRNAFWDIMLARALRK